MDDQKQGLGLFGNFAGTITVTVKDGIRGISVSALDATDVTITGNLLRVGGVDCTPIVVNNTKPTVTFASEEGSYFDGVTIDCTEGTADIMMFQ